MRNQRGKGPENPGKLLKRLMGMLMKHYGAAIIIVAICIIINVLANVQGTMFMQRLIDDYITPLLESETKNYTPLLHAIGLIQDLKRKCRMLLWNRNYCFVFL